MIRVLFLEQDKYYEYPVQKQQQVEEIYFEKVNETIVTKQDGEKKQLELYKEYQISEKKRIFCIGENEKRFERLDVMSIGINGKSIQIPNCEFDLFVENNKILIRNAGQVYHNAKKTEERTLTITEGDSFFIDGCFLCFFNQYIDINYNCYQSNLLELNKRQGYFEGFPYYKRSPRVIKHVKTEKIKIEKPPQKSTLSKNSLMQIIIPPLCMIAITVTISLLRGRGIYILMSVGMTGCTLIFSVQRFFTEKKENKRKNKKRNEIYSNYLLKMRKKIRKLREQEQEAIKYQYPELKQLDTMIHSYDSRIYERSALDGDFLTINLGYRNAKSEVQVSFDSSDLEMEQDDLIDEAKEVRNQYQKIDNKPITIDLKKSHLGLVGSNKNIIEQIKLIIAQLTFFQSYHDLEIIFISSMEYQKEFEYLRWYPHLKIKAINVLGIIHNERTRDQILGSLSQILKDRKLKQEEENKDVIYSPHYVFIVQEPKFIINHAIMEYLQEKTMNLGFSIIYASNQKANLPENITSVCILEDHLMGRLLLKEGEMVDYSFKLSHIDNINLEAEARDLAALIHEKGITSSIPESITFFELYGVNKPEELAIEQRWNKNEAYKTLAVPLGVRSSNDIVELNLHEKAHGPHGLVAGTTGSGKSEIVQSYILSLAVNYHPYEVGFLLIDYKGGGMASLFDKLPHLLGKITNLDGSQSIRAMASIKSELERRQEIFNQNSVNHINAYNKLFKQGKVKEPLPHLFLISDEFAELKKEQPEFMSELVSTARIGRSLGIHLILATQKPSGVVDDQIWTNSKFKLCLKVQNESDSREMLKTSDAASITQPGRAYLQVGNNEIYELFQSAWSGAGFFDEDKKDEIDNRVYLINELGQGELVNSDLSSKQDSNQIMKTELEVVVEQIQTVYNQGKYIQVKKPWLPPLEDVIVSPYMTELVDSRSHTELNLIVPVGLVDIPEKQSQEEYLLDFLNNGHMLYVSSSGYGKSTLLGTIITTLAVNNSVENLNIYILDYGNSGLIPYYALPHVADYITADDNEKFQKFVAFIHKEIKQRKVKLAKAMVQNFEVYNHIAKERLKAIVIVIDQFDVIREMGYEIEEFFQKVARDGASLGIYLVLSATRSNGIKYATLNNIKTKIAGFNFDENEVRALVGRSEYALPEVRGRAMVKLENVNTMQIYTCVTADSDMEYSENIKNLIQTICNVSTEEKARGIPVLPETLLVEDMSKYPAYKVSSTFIPIGLDINSLEVVGLDLSEPVQLILGGNKTGKTNSLKTVLHYLEGKTVFLIDSSTMELNEYSQNDSVHYVSEENELIEFAGKLQKLIGEREESFKIEKEKNKRLIPKQYYHELPPIYIVIDVLQDFVEKLEKVSTKEFNIEQILINAANVGVYFVVTSNYRIRATNIFASFVKETKGGVVLGDIKEQLIFTYTGIRETNTQVDMGYLHLRGSNSKIKLPDNTSS